MGEGWGTFWSPTLHLCPRFLTQHWHAAQLSCRRSILFLSPCRSTNAWMHSAQCVHNAHMLTRRLDSGNQSSCLCHVLRHTWGNLLLNSIVILDCGGSCLGLWQQAAATPCRALRLFHLWCGCFVDTVQGVEELTEQLTLRPAFIRRRNSLLQGAYVMSVCQSRLA